MDFLSTYAQYSSVNKDLVKGIQERMAKVQSILATFAEVETNVTKINSKVVGLDDLLKKMEETKSKGLANLDKTIQPLIDSNIKKYKKLQNLFDEMTKQKMYVVGQYQMDLDEFLTNNLQSRYNRSQFTTLKNDIANYKAKYYTKTNQLNCSSILSTVDEGTALLTRINTMKIAVGS
jgi:DNA repair exonuclease SbcCD ATPase subunit